MPFYRIVETTNRGYAPFFHIQKRVFNLFWWNLNTESDYVSFPDKHAKTFDSLQDAEKWLKEYLKDTREVVRVYHDLEV